MGTIVPDPNAVGKSADLAKWDLILKAVTTFVALATIIFAVVQYEGNVREHQISAYRESSQPFLEKQLATYFEVSDVSSHLATAVDPASIDKKSLRRFWELYWGQLGLVETEAVDEAMVTFGAYLNAFQHKKVDSSCLQRSSLYLQHELARSLESEWGRSALPNALPNPYPIVSNPCLIDINKYRS